VKDELLLNFKVQDGPGASNPRSLDQSQAGDLKLADQIVARVG
jgi:hypothetical protein